jgi:hypothetical protein
MSKWPDFCGKKSGTSAGRFGTRETKVRLRLKTGTLGLGCF